MTLRTTIYLGQALRGLLESRPEDAGLWSRSGTINAVAARYVEVCHHHLPRLTLEQWRTCISALAAQQPEDLTLVWARVYAVDQELGQRIREMPYAELVALVDAVERHRAQHGDTITTESIAAVVGEEHVAP